MNTNVSAEQMATANKTNQLFTAAYNRCNNEIPHNHQWTDGAGHYDYAVYGPLAPKLAYGSMAKSMTRGGRRMLMIGTRLGNMVIYDRFVNQAPGQADEARAVFFYDTTNLIKVGGWFGRTYLDEFDMALAVGDDVEKHIGWRIDQIHSGLRKAQQQRGEEDAA